MSPESKYTVSGQFHTPEDCLVKPENIEMAREVKADLKAHREIAERLGVSRWEGITWKPEHFTLIVSEADSNTHEKLVDALIPDHNPHVFAVPDEYEKSVEAYLADSTSPEARAGLQSLVEYVTTTELPKGRTLLEKLGLEATPSVQSADAVNTKHEFAGELAEAHSHAI